MEGNEKEKKYSRVSQWVCRKLKSAFEGILIARLKAKGGGGTPRLALMNAGSFCFMFGSDGISLDYNYKLSLYNNYIVVII